MCFCLLVLFALPALTAMLASFANPCLPCLRLSRARAIWLCNFQSCRFCLQRGPRQKKKPNGTSADKHLKPIGYRRACAALLALFTLPASLALRARMPIGYRRACVALLASCLRCLHIACIARIGCVACNAAGLTIGGDRTG